MTERSIVEAAARLRRHGEPYLVATVVAVHGSAYRRPGARMLLTRFRWVAGTVSGGCLEGDISNQGWALTKDGAPVILSYDATRLGDAPHDEDIRSAFGLGCDGVVEVMLERAGAPGRIDALEFSARCLRAQRRGALVTVFRSEHPGVRVGARLALSAGGALETEAIELDPAIKDAMALDMQIALESGVTVSRSYSTANGTVEALIEPVLPPPRLFLFGTGHDAVPVAQLARQVGWDVVVCAKDPKFSTRERFGMVDELIVGSPEELAARIHETDRAVAVVMSHDYERDRENLGMLMSTNARYIGVLGARSRTHRMLADVGQIEDSRVHSPIGLELGAETPQEIALAIIGEIQSTLSRMPAASARDIVTFHHDRAGAGSAQVLAAAVAL